MFQNPTSVRELRYLSMSCNPELVEAETLRVERLVEGLTKSHAPEPGPPVGGGGVPKPDARAGTSIFIYKL